MRLKILFLSVLCVCQAVKIEEDNWELFKRKYNKTYENNDEESYRKQIFEDNQLKVAEHMEQFDAGEVTYTIGINRFSDWTQDEFEDRMLAIKPRNITGRRQQSTFINTGRLKLLPDMVDWRDKNAVTPVKDQGEYCKSSWAFSTIGAIESANYLQKGELIRLSEQQLIDCDRNDGCDYGDINFAYNYALWAPGLVPEDSYPYEDVERDCRLNETNIVMKLEKFGHTEYGNEYELTKAIAEIGPISVSVDGRKFKEYKSGIFDVKNCWKDLVWLNHCAIAVGYGRADGEDYYIVKNSWGADWGENGYIRMSRNKNNQCGIATEPFYPIKIQ